MGVFQGRPKLTCRDCDTSNAIATGKSSESPAMIELQVLLRGDVVAEGKKSAIRAIAKLDRTELALNYRKQGLSYRAIAARIAAELAIPKYSAQAAHRDVAERFTELNRALSHGAEELRALENARLDSYLSALGPSIELGTAGENGGVGCACGGENSG
jgi:hypothetical protein